MLLKDTSIDAPGWRPLWRLFLPLAIGGAGVALYAATSALFDDPNNWLRLLASVVFLGLSGAGASEAIVLFANLLIPASELPKGIPRWVAVGSSWHARFVGVIERTVFTLLVIVAIQPPPDSTFSRQDVKDVEGVLVLMGVWLVLKSAVGWQRVGTPADSDGWFVRARSPSSILGSLVSLIATVAAAIGFWRL